MTCHPEPPLCAVRKEGSEEVENIVSGWQQMDIRPDRRHTDDNCRLRILTHADNGAAPAPHRTEPLNTINGPARSLGHQHAKHDDSGGAEVEVESAVPPSTDGHEARGL
jgi:hypothetical protein